MTDRRTAFVGAVLVTLVAAAACGSPAPTSYSGPSGSALLQALPDGLVTLSPAGAGLAAETSLFGLQPGTTVTLSLLRGSCLAPGPTVEVFGHAAVARAGTVVTRLSGDREVPSPFPSPANVTVTQSGQVIGCTDLSAGQPTEAERMYPVPSARGVAAATVRTDRSSGRVTASLAVTGLAGTAPHAVALLAGQCNEQGAVVVELGGFSPKPDGTAAAGLTGQAPGPAKAHPWSIEVFAGPSAGGGGRPVLCGNLPSG